MGGGWMDNDPTPQTTAIAPDTQPPQTGPTPLAPSPAPRLKLCLCLKPLPPILRQAHFSSSVAHSRALPGLPGHTFVTAGPRAWAGTCCLCRQEQGAELSTFTLPTAGLGKGRREASGPYQG